MNWNLFRRMFFHRPAVYAEDARPVPSVRPKGPPPPMPDDASLTGPLDLSEAHRIFNSWPKWKRDLAEQVLKPSVQDVWPGSPPPFETELRKGDDGVTRLHLVGDPPKALFHPPAKQGNT